jgi:hypothetical protein
MVKADLRHAEPVAKWLAYGGFMGRLHSINRNP